jgi:folate-binding protein YgfZ
MSAETAALARSAVVWRRRAERAVVTVTGTQRLDWLQGLLTNDVARLSDGGACYTAWLTPQGRMITDADVIETGEATWLDVPASLAEALSGRLDSMIFAEDVGVGVARDLSSLGIYGPRTAETMSRILDGAVPATVVEPYRSHSVGTNDGPIVVIGADHLGVPGAHVYGAAATVDRLATRLADAGVASLDEETAEVLRVEAGRPAFLQDMSEETIPLEAGIDARALSHTKGCYVGQEIIVRMRDRGQGRVARKLVGLEIDGTSVPAPGAVVFAGDRQVGRVTSAVRSIVRQAPIALAIVQRDHVEPGTELEVRADDGAISARVTPLPFVS